VETSHHMRSVFSQATFYPCFYHCEDTSLQVYY